MESKTIVIEDEKRQRCMDKERICALERILCAQIYSPEGYSPEGSGFILGTNNYNVLDKCIRRIDKTKKKYLTTLARAKKLKTKKMKNLLWSYRKNYHIAETTARNIVRDLHYKSAHFLCQSFDTILYPNFNTQSIAQCKLNKIHEVHDCVQASPDLSIFRAPQANGHVLY